MESGENKIFASKFSLKGLCFHLYMILVTGFFVYISIVNMIEKSNVSMFGEIIFMTVFLLLFGFSIKDFLLLSKIIFYENSLEIIDFWGLRKRKFDYYNIQSWSTEQKRSKKTKITWEELVIQFHNNEKILLKSYNYTNYPQIYEKISSIEKINNS